MLAALLRAEIVDATLAFAAPLPLLMPDVFVTLVAATPCYAAILYTMPVTLIDCRCCCCRPACYSLRFRHDC